MQSDTPVSPTSMTSYFIILLKEADTDSLITGSFGGNKCIFFTPRFVRTETERCEIVIRRAA